MTNDNKLINDIKETLDESVDSLDANILSRIRQVRAQAVEKSGNQSVNWFGVVAGGLATASVMALAIIIVTQTSDTSSNLPVDDIELISSSDSLELYEDLEFYEWLEDEDLYG